MFKYALVFPRTEKCNILGDLINLTKYTLLPKCSNTVLIFKLSVSIPRIVNLKNIRIFL